MKKLLTLVTILFCIVISAQEKKNREAFKLKLAVDKKHYYTTDVPQSPYFVKDKTLQLFCTEKVFVEAEIKDDTIHSMKVVEKVQYPERTIEISFTQDDKDREHINTMLNVKNPFDKPLVYDAMMYTPYEDKWFETSIVPIYPKIQGFETWPHTIITLALDNWRFEKPKK